MPPARRRIFGEIFAPRGKQTQKFTAAAEFVGILVGIPDQTIAAAFPIPKNRIEQMARQSDGACANPNLIGANVDCSAAWMR